jgi:hypothetical protein
MRKHERILALTMDKESEAQGDHAAITEISSSLDKLMT